MCHFLIEKTFFFFNCFENKTENNILKAFENKKIFFSFRLQNVGFITDFWIRKSEKREKRMFIFYTQKEKKNVNETKFIYSRKGGRDLNEI